MVEKFVAAFVTLFVLYAVGGVVRGWGHNIEFLKSLKKTFNWIMVFEVIGEIVLWLIVIVLLLQFELLQYGWTSLFKEDPINIILEPILIALQHENPIAQILTVGFILLLLVLAPFSAQREEAWFRKRKRGLGRLILWAIIGAMTHMVFGIPFALALALVVPNLFFAMKYRETFRLLERYTDSESAEQEALLIATSYYTVHNVLLILAILGAVLVVLW